MPNLKKFHSLPLPKSAASQKFHTQFSIIFLLKICSTSNLPSILITIALREKKTIIDLFIENNLYWTLHLSEFLRDMNCLLTFFVLWRFFFKFKYLSSFFVIGFSVFFLENFSLLLSQIFNDIFLICWYSFIQTLERDRLVILNRCLIARVLRALNLTERCLPRFVMPTTGVSFSLGWGWNFYLKRKIEKHAQHKTKIPKRIDLPTFFVLTKEKIIDF